MVGNFFIASDNVPLTVLQGDYSFYLVLLSYAVASVASYAGLFIAGNISRARSHDVKNLLHVGGAFALGSGIWSMHFIGMLAYHMKIPFHFDFGLTVFSILIAIACAVAFLSVTRFDSFKLKHIVIGSTLLGLAICTMHYTGMAAIRMEANLFHTPGLFLLSLIVAVSASAVALGFLYLERHNHSIAHAVPLRMLASLILGLGVCGMHYTGMAAANFLPLAAACRPSDGEAFLMMDADKISLMITIVTAVILILTLTVGIYNQEQNAIADVRESDAFPMKLIGLSVCLTFLSILVLGGFSAKVARQMQILTAKDEKMHALSIGYLQADKKLANALSLYTITGDQKWADGYFTHAYEQQAILGELKEVVNNDETGEFTAFDLFEEKRSRLDREVLNLAGSVSLRSASLLLQSRQYQAAKTEYETSFDSSLKKIADSFYKATRKLVQVDYMIMFLSLVSALILSIFWYFSFRSVRRWQKELIETRNNLNERYLEKEALEKRMAAYLEEVKRARDRALQAMHEADHANQTKTDFLTNMSHELRTPMNSILGLTELLLRNEKTIPEHKELLAVILEAGETLLKIVNDLLDIAKIEAEGLVLQKRNFTLRTMLNNVVNTLKPMADEKGLKIVSDFDEKEISIIEDELRLSRIFTNLLGNAIKYTDEGTIHFYAKILPGRGATSVLRAEITDTGIGISQENIDIIFEKFSQADNSTTRKYGGTGLGLAITKELVELMDGKIGVESRIGEGSKFWAEIPVEATAFTFDEEVKPVRAKAYNRDGLIGLQDVHILIAEDHPLNQIYMQTLFMEIGFKNVVFANDGLEALDILKENLIDLVLMDCQMPELNGYETTKRIREAEKQTGQHLPIVAMTARAMVGDRQDCLDAGMDDYISKPIDVETLQRILSRWIDMNPKS